MKYLILMTLSLTCSLAFAEKVDFENLSKSLVKVSKGISQAKTECGSDLRDVVEVQITNGVTEFQFNLQKRGSGRMGGTVFKSCKATLRKDTRPTWHDGATIYTFNYKNNFKPRN